MDEVVRLRRGMVLHALHVQYPLSLAQAALERQIAPHYMFDRLAKESTRDLAYLREKGLIAREEQKIGEAVIVTWRITPAGIDLVEGVATDPAIDVGSAK